MQRLGGVMDQRILQALGLKGNWLGRGDWGLMAGKPSPDRSSFLVYLHRSSKRGTKNSLFQYSKGTSKKRTKPKNKILFAILSLGIKALGKAIGKLNVEKNRR